MLLAQIDPKPIAEGLGRDFLPWALLGVCVALGFAVKHIVALYGDATKLRDAKDAQLKELRDQKDAEISKLRDELLAQVLADAAEKRKILEGVMPLQTRLLEMLELTKEEA